MKTVVVVGVFILVACLQLQVNGWRIIHIGGDRGIQPGNNQNTCGGSSVGGFNQCPAVGIPKCQRGQVLKSRGEDLTRPFPECCPTYYCSDNQNTCGGSSVGGFNQCPAVGIPKCQPGQVLTSRGEDLTRPFPECCPAYYCSDNQNTCGGSSVDGLNQCPAVGIPKCQPGQVLTSRGEDLTRPFPECCPAYYCSDNQNTCGGSSVGGFNQCPAVGIPKCQPGQVLTSRGEDLTRPFPECCPAYYCSDNQNTCGGSSVDGLNQCPAVGIPKCQPGQVLTSRGEDLTRPFPECCPAYYCSDNQNTCGGSSVGGFNQCPAVGIPKCQRGQVLKSRGEDLTRPFPECCPTYYCSDNQNTCGGSAVGGLNQCPAVGIPKCQRGQVLTSRGEDLTRPFPECCPVYYCRNP